MNILQQNCKTVCFMCAFYPLLSLILLPGLHFIHDLWRVRSVGSPPTATTMEPGTGILPRKTCRGPWIGAEFSRLIQKSCQSVEKVWQKKPWLGGGFKNFLFSSLPGEDSHFDQYFSDGLKPPTRWPKRRCCFLGDPNARRAFFVSKIVDFQGSLPMCFKTEVWQIFLAGKFADYICNIYIYNL